MTVQANGLALYDRTARRGSAQVISYYSTSFGLASRLCSRAVRTHVAGIYALVRIADEIVDGPAEEAGLGPGERRELLDALEVETERAVACGYSSNLVVHAFAQTARATGFGAELTRPFFASMRRDLDPVDFDDEELRTYIYGSAEVVGLMCLRAFSEGRPADASRDERWQRGARHLGAAFQKINFLRDLADDYDTLGRRYFPGVDPRHLGEADKTRLLDDIDHDLAIAGAVIPELPSGCRRAVAAAHALFSALSARLRRTPASELLGARVSVPTTRKLLLLLPGQRGTATERDRVSRVAVIGAGIAGLATAALLARDGHQVTVYEAHAGVGGRAGRWDASGFRFDTGPSWYLMPEVFEHFYRLMGTTAAEQLDLVRLEPGYRVFFEHHPDALDVFADRERAAAAFEAIEPGAARALERYLDSAAETTRLALDHFLYNDFSSPRTLLVPPVLRRLGRLGRLLLQPLDRFVARRFRDARLRQVLGYPAVFLGTSPSAAPSMYHLMSHFDLDDGVFYPQGGFREVIDSFARLNEGAGVRVVTRARVTGIRVDEGVARGIRYLDARGHAHEVAADVVVSAADVHHTERVLLPVEARSRSDASWRRSDPGPGAVLVMLGVRGALPGLVHHNLLFTEDWDDNFARIFGDTPSVPDPASLYVCKPSATDPTVAPAGHENLFVLVPVPADPSIGRGGVDGRGDAAVERIADAAIAQIAAWTGIHDLAERVVVRRTVGPGDFESEFNSWRGSALGPGHTLRQSAFLRGRTASSAVRGLYFAGATTVPGIGLPMCLISAELVAKALRGETGAGPIAEPAASTTDHDSAGHGDPRGVAA